MYIRVPIRKRFLFFFFLYFLLKRQSAVLLNLATRTPSTTIPALRPRRTTVVTHSLSVINGHQTLATSEPASDKFVFYFFIYFFCFTVLRLNRPFLLPTSASCCAPIPEYRSGIPGRTGFFFHFRKPVAELRSVTTSWYTRTVLRRKGARMVGCRVERRIHVLCIRIQAEDKII